MRRALLLLVAIALGACRKDPPPAPDPAPSASASAPRGVSDFPEDPDAPRPPQNLGPAPANSAATRQTREKHVLDLLAGKLPAADVADEPTDPEAKFDPQLRPMLTHQLRRGEVRLNAVRTTGIGVEVVTRVARERLPFAHACYRRGLRFNPNLQGIVIVNLTIGAEGNVTEVTNGGSDVPDGQVVSCVLSTFRGVAVARPVAAEAKAKVPVLLSPGD